MNLGKFTLEIASFCFLVILVKLCGCLSIYVVAFFALLVVRVIAKALLLEEKSFKDFIGSLNSALIYTVLVYLLETNFALSYLDSQVATLVTFLVATSFLIAEEYVIEIK